MEICAGTQTSHTLVFNFDLKEFYVNSDTIGINALTIQTKLRQNHIGVLILILLSETKLMDITGLKRIQDMNSFLHNAKNCPSLLIKIIMIKILINGKVRLKD